MNDTQEKHNDPHLTIAPPTSSPTSKGEIIAGAGLFLFLGLILTLMELPYEWMRFVRDSAFGSIIFAMFFIVPATGYGIGWVKGFPRWSYPYVGVLILISLYFMNASTPGISFFGFELFGRELWGWRSWAPLLFATSLALVISRSFQPVKKFFTNGWEDWTLFTFCMFGCLPLLVLVGFDEVDNRYTLSYTTGLYVVTILTAYVYLRSLKMWQRALVLGIGTVIPIVVASLGSTLYWLEHGWVSVPGMIKASFYIILVMFAPAFFGLLRYADNPSPPEWKT